MNKLEWDLESILEGKSLDSLYHDWTSQQDKLLAMYDDIFKSSNNFENWIFESEKMSILTNRIYNYVSNKANEDLSEQWWIAWNQKLAAAGNAFSTKISDYDNRILKEHKKITEYLKSPKIAEYKKYFDQTLRYKKYTLSTKEEKLLSEIDNCFDGYDDINRSLIDNEIKFADALDSKNKAHQLKTASDVIVNLKSKDRELRKNSLINFTKAYYNFKNVLTYNLYYNYLTLNKTAQVRNFESYVHACCFADEIDIKLIHTIYKCVKEFKYADHQYITHKKSLIKQLLNLKKLEPWDYSIDLSKSKITFTVDQAQAIVLEALECLGEEYLSVVKKAFNENWISWLPKENKRSGAYSIGGTKGLNKYFILLNYDSTLSSVYTLIHELGHSINSYFYSTHQKVYQSTTIFCAEIASIVNEMFLNYYLLKKYENNEKMRLIILEELISGFFATVNRQVLFSNFEYDINLKILNHEPITSEVIYQTYFKLMQEYSIIKNPQKSLKKPYVYSLYTPLRIPHFYAGNFYVYKYAIGQVVAILVVDAIMNNQPKMLDKYMQFLKSGTSLSPIDTIKLLDIDLYDEKTWNKALKIVEKFISMFKKIKKI